MAQITADVGRSGGDINLFPIWKLLDPSIRLPPSDGWLIDKP